MIMDTQSFWEFVREAAPAVAVVAFVVAAIIWGVRPIAEKMLDKLAPLLDRAITVVESQGAASLKLASVLEKTMETQTQHFEERIETQRQHFEERIETQRQHFEERIVTQRQQFEGKIEKETGERLEQIAMLQLKITDLETENATLKQENISLKEQVKKLQEQLSERERQTQKGNVKKT